MFRMRKIFEDHRILIFKIEGYITEENVGAWTEEIDGMKSQNGQQIVFDCCSVSFINSKALEILMGRLSEEIYLMNCPVGLRNMLHAAGRSTNLLD